MKRRIGAFFVFIGCVVLTVSLVLAMGDQPSGRPFFMGLSAVVVGVWTMLRSAGAAPLMPPPPPAAAPPVTAKAKSAPKPPGPPAGGGGPPKGGGKPKGRSLSGLFQPRSKSRS